MAIYLVTSSKGGISAMELERQMGFGSYQTAWVWRHKIKKAMVRPDREPLAVRVEVNRRIAERLGHRFARVIEHAVQIAPTTCRTLVAAA